MKYEKEARGLFGTMRLKEDGTLEGIKISIFNYTEREVVLD